MHASALLVVTVAAVGVLHTIVPDHWLPIALLARQRGWAWPQTARTAALAGTGHAFSTLAIAGLVWIAGVALAARLGHVASLLSSLGLVVFGSWIALASWREISQAHPSHGHANVAHVHIHRHSDATEHRHWHDHHVDERHETDFDPAIVPVHEHAHETSSRTWLLLILGSSPMVEAIPAFFAASRYGVELLVLMAIIFAVSTIVTYVLLCLGSAGGLHRIHLGRFERYGEIISGLFVALIGLVFFIVPSL